MVTLKIDVPEVEQRIRDIAAAQNMDAEKYLVELVTAHLPARTALGQKQELSPQQRKEALHRWAERHSTDAPLLSDEAVRRESMYADRGL